MEWVILVGHGAPPRDAPRELTSRLKALEGRRAGTGQPAGDEERTLDAKLRAWPRTPESDPYSEGVENLARSLRSRLEGTRLVVAYNEFCAPSLDAAVERAVAEGASRIVVVPTMLTPGGVHSEEEIPELLAGLRARFPSTPIRYAWPFDLDDVAALLARRVASA
jgi:sirohydrochlorin cobaltochelatase